MSDCVLKFNFSADEIERCKAAMAKPAPRGALLFIASPAVVAELSSDGRDIYLDMINGSALRDRGRKMTISGAWPLFRAGMIDADCKVTDIGRQLIDAMEGGAE
jgi:hypothetical protein